MPIARRLLLPVLVALAGCASSAPAPDSFTFALIGDAPYGAKAVEPFERMLAAINADAEVALLLHAGDIKAAAEPCSDALIRERFAQLQQLRMPVVYTPGDNEWTDCWNSGAGRHHPLERLAFLRKTFYPQPRATTGGQKLPVQTQADDTRFAEFVENVRFERAGVVFATLHVVGSSNDLAPWRGLPGGDSARQPRPERIAAFERREAANLAWLDAAFDRAEATQARGVVLLMQANPRFELEHDDADRAGFDRLITRLQTRAARFGKPVLLAHGDFHTYVVDRPLDKDHLDPRVPNLVRVQTFGAPLIGWVRIRIDPADPALFRIDAR